MNLKYKYDLGISQSDLGVRGIHTGFSKSRSAMNEYIVSKHKSDHKNLFTIISPNFAIHKYSIPKPLKIRSRGIPTRPKVVRNSSGIRNNKIQLFMDRFADKTSSPVKTKLARTGTAGWKLASNERVRFETVQRLKRKVVRYSSSMKELEPLKKSELY